MGVCVRVILLCFINVAVKESGKGIVDVDVDGVHTNIVMVKVVKSGLTPAELCFRLSQVQLCVICLMFFIALPRLVEMVAFDRSIMSSYWRSMVTMALSCIISEIKRNIGGKSYFFVPHLHYR